MDFAGNILEAHSLAHRWELLSSPPHRLFRRVQAVRSLVRAASHIMPASDFARRARSNRVADLTTCRRRQGRSIGFVHLTAIGNPLLAFGFSVSEGTVPAPHTAPIGTSRGGQDKVSKQSEEPSCGPTSLESRRLFQARQGVTPRLAVPHMLPSSE